MWSLEPCKPCQGNGVIGTLAGYHLICESCLGDGKLMIRRMMVRNVIVED